MTNTAYIYQPHFKTSKFRVACKDQLGEEYNYIVVTCSPEYNGVYKYEAKNIKDKQYELWKNGYVNCICVPINDCIKIKELKEVTNPDVIKEVKKQQKSWLTNNVTNRDYNYKEKPEWML